VGAGLYDVTLESGIGDSESVMFVGIHQTGVNGTCLASHTSNTVKRVETRSAGVLTNIKFDFIVFAFPQP
jgi:hypothetical protein